MRRRGARFVAGLLVMGSACVPAAAETAVAPLPVDAVVGDLDQAALTAAWWQWALSLPVEPYMDRDGSWCGVGQQGPVWFLAGTDGSFDAQRHCQVPLDTHLFVPVAGRHATTPLAAKKESKLPGCEELQEQVAMPPAGLLRAKVTIDGMEVKDIAAYRVRSPGCFDPYPGLPPVEGKLAPLAASDGYWLLIPPLTPGTHRLSVDVHYRREGEKGFEMLQRFEYTLQLGSAPRYVMR